MKHPRKSFTAQDMYEATGTEKWQEFIDAKDYVAAKQEQRDGKIFHPGEYYNWQRLPDGRRVYIGNHWEAFLKADRYVSEAIDKQIVLNAKKYYTIHMLVASGYESLCKKGWRKGSVTWKLTNVTADKIKHVLAKGLLVEIDQEMECATVTVPGPDRPIKNTVQQLFNEHYKQSKDDPFLAMVQLYIQLEVLHPTENASSRTNHLILNKLLVEQGKYPAILIEPNAPELGREAVVQAIIEASERGKTIAMKQALTAENLQDAREKRKKAEEAQRKLNEIMIKMGIRSKNK